MFKLRQTIIAIFLMPWPAMSTHLSQDLDLKYQIALHIIPFLEVFPRTHDTLQYCVYSTKINEASEKKMILESEKIKPKFAMRINHHLDESCNILLVDTDNQRDNLLLLKDFSKKSLIIGYGYTSIIYGSDMAITNLGNKYQLVINEQSIKMKNIKLSPQILKISKIYPN